MTISDFIKKAIAGGYEGIENSDSSEATCPCCGGLWIIDPLAWQAVGKVEGWNEGVEGGRMDMHNHWNLPGWHEKMHRMIDALAEGKTIEEFLKIL